MSPILLLLALQADAPLDRPAAKAKPAAARKAPTPKANPTIIYAPAAKADEPAAAAAAPAEDEARPPIGLSKPALERILAERKANAERQATNRKALEEVQQRIDRALAAEPFDLEALKAALLERDRIATDYRQKLTASVLAMLDAVPADERLAVAHAVIKGELPKRAEAKPAEPKPAATGR